MTGGSAESEPLRVRSAELAVLAGGYLALFSLRWGLSVDGEPDRLLVLFLLYDLLLALVLILALAASGDWRKRGAELIGPLTGRTATTTLLGLVGYLVLTSLVATGWRAIAGEPLQWGDPALVGRLFGGWPALAGTLAVGGAALEEIGFRGWGVVVPGRSRAGWRIAAVALSTLLFALLHEWEPDALIHSLTTGLFFAALAWRARSVVPPLVVHCAANGVLMILFTAGGRGAL